MRGNNVPKLPPGHRPASDRIETTCDVCGQTDDHPKDHSIDGTSAHLDCRNTPELVALLDASGRKHGAELAAYLQGDVNRG